MANNLADYAENKILDHLLGKASFTMPTNAYIALFTVTPGEAGGGTEVTGGSYVRKQTLAADWNAAAAGSISNLADITFVTASASWGLVVAVGIFDAVSAGNLLWYGPLTSNKTVDSGDTFKFAGGTPGQLSMSLN